MTTQEMQTTDERMKREQLQVGESDDTIGDTIDTRGEAVETKPLITPSGGIGSSTHMAESERWQQIQAEFVDDPRKAVGDAHALVGDMVQQIVDTFTRERNDLESQWSKGDDVSTEDLRQCLQHYREFFARLLPSAHGTPSHT